MRDPRPKIPDTLTLVESQYDGLFKTLVIADEEFLVNGRRQSMLVVRTTVPEGNGAFIRLTEKQAKQLRGRIDKFFRDNR